MLLLLLIDEKRVFSASVSASVSVWADRCFVFSAVAVCFDHQEREVNKQINLFDNRTESKCIKTKTS
jgi:hypothetical protein